MKPNTYEIIQRCLEEGIEMGYNRAFKYLNGESLPSKEVLLDNIQAAVMNEICTYFKFEVKE